MTICDRCESRDNVERYRITIDFDAHENSTAKLDYTVEFCTDCIANLGRAIDAALEPLPRIGQSSDHVALRAAVEFGLSRFCDPHALTVDPAAVTFKRLAEAALEPKEAKP